MLGVNSFRDDEIGLSALVGGVPNMLWSGVEGDPFGEGHASGSLVVVLANRLVFEIRGPEVPEALEVPDTGLMRPNVP